jgi:protein-S-isoprenylcysteine O-methyltransferase Ste14
MLYAVVSYAIGMAGVVCLVLVLAGWLPWGFLLPAEPGLAVIWNLGLVVVWGAIHSGMARQGFKDRLTGVMPEPAERPTYVLVAGLTTVCLAGFWQMVPGVLWSVTGDLAIGLLWGLFAFGWLYLVAATFAINHFDLFGLRQAYYHFLGQPRPRLEFVRRAMYRVTRHPIQTGVLIGVWATPEMTMTQLILSIGFTVYIFIGLHYEERDLIREFGATYEAYRGETGMVLPRLRPPGR